MGDPASYFKWACLRDSVQGMCFRIRAFCLPLEGVCTGQRALRGKAIIILLLVYNLLGSSQMEI